MKWLFILAAPQELFVTILYWATDYSALSRYKDSCDNLFMCYFWTFTVHLICLVPTWSILFFSKTNLKKNQIIAPLIYICVYLTMLVILTQKWGSVYSVIDFSDGKTGGSIFWIIVGVLTEIGAFFLAFWISGKTRSRYYREFVKNDKGDGNGNFIKGGNGNNKKSIEQ